MNGHRMHTDNHNISSRRAFFKKGLQVLSAAAAIPLISSCTEKVIGGGMVGADYKVGHLLRTPEKIPQPTSYLDTDILIAGGGISGLSAKRWLNKHGYNPMLVELSDSVGGNSAYGENATSAYPWGAHYLPIPENTDTELLDFLHSANVITGFDNHNLPIYNEFHLCHDPEERLYINGYWQEGLVPKFGISNEDQKQIDRFFSYIEVLKKAVGEDGKYHFAIPIDRSSTSTLYKWLDKMSFAEFLKREKYTSPYLLWYLEYCCKDDYGSLLQDTSAWAGIHYFASRRGTAANAPNSAVITWPEGNGYLMNELKKQCNDNIHTGLMTYKVVIRDDLVEVFCYDTHKQESIIVRTKKLLLCTPQYINKRILTPIVKENSVYEQQSYAPWVVANITLSKLPYGKGAPLSWDNVIYGQYSVGYVFANHQQLSRKNNGVITYYLPVATADAQAARRNVYQKDYNYWKKLIIKELSYAHPGISESIAHIDVRVWGHGMIRPSAGYIWGRNRQKAMQPINNKIFFAHSDLSGISIFEEAFYQGIRAAKEIMNVYPNGKQA